MNHNQGFISGLPDVLAAVCRLTPSRRYGLQDLSSRPSSASSAVDDALQCSSLVPQKFRGLHSRNVRDGMRVPSPRRGIQLTRVWDALQFGDKFLRGNGDENFQFPFIFRGSCPLSSGMYPIIKLELWRKHCSFWKRILQLHGWDANRRKC